MIRPIAQAALAVGAYFVLSATPTQASDPVTFKGKTVTVIITAVPGGGTDLPARLFAKYFSKHLPGSPAFVASNMPGGHGVIGLNHLTQRAKPDGLSWSMASSSQADPITYRSPQSKYDATELTIIGSVGVGDNGLTIRTDALPRLLDKSKPPVAMGSVQGAPRAGMRMAMWGAEYLGWNTKWVVGYQGTADLTLALERGEIDMTSFPTPHLTEKLTDTSRFKIIYQDGDGTNKTGRADLDNAPLFTGAMQGKISDPLMTEAFNYWQATMVFKWMALPPKTPAPIRDTYREAFRKTLADPEFVAQAQQTMPGYTVLTAERTEKVIHDLASASDAALSAMDDLLRKQGLNVAKKDVQN